MNEAAAEYERLKKALGADHYEITSSNTSTDINTSYSSGAPSPSGYYYPDPNTPGKFVTITIPSPYDSGYFGSGGNVYQSPDPSVSFQDRRDGYLPVQEVEVPEKFGQDVGVREGSRFYTMGEVYIAVCQDEKLGWTLSMSGKRRFPSMVNVKQAIYELIPEGVKMAMIVPDWSSQDHTLNFYEYLGEVAPKTVNYDRKDNGHV